jgi:hypothetical protein
MKHQAGPKYDSHEEQSEIGSRSGGARLENSHSSSFEGNSVPRMPDRGNQDPESGIRVSWVSAPIVFSKGKSGAASLSEISKAANIAGR